MEESIDGTHNFIIFFSYIGIGFNGSAYQKDNNNTVENKLIERLQQLDLISDSNCSFSRVSRTDKGVSARMNALTIRLKIKYPHLSISIIEKIYLKELNKKLKNIQIIHIQCVPNNFDARLNCIQRTYVYFFINKNYNIAKMNEAAKIFLGEHDFSNFCKKRKNNTSFIRTIHKFEIKNIDQNFYYFKIKGTSFLYNQIRHMVAALFLVGKGQLDEQDIKTMLENNSIKNKNYKIADECGLLLYSFKFSDINFNFNVDNKIFLNVMNKYIQTTILVVSLCYPLKIKKPSENFFENINDETKEILQ
ncbi:tRNA pseudouridine(38-40) synthase [Plasmodium yoelii 17X]|nr:tRNA pseudouridine synthase, putative [Plasmodium yoelii]ETB60385.1 tRNA pseudouridine(38-40) synthase [Plasmodium yoelii 17X]CDU17491.1 tRNA pseudouridine synthase, putative [Plasmodium yoelii]VTZ77258.1 tRNA pseudouridine synthase, putative [Plasmodium yoelii]|eukprot:XP_022811929.1 tRNA pseudouridine synthase, putative [Plasmodium yoelii]